MIIDSLKMAVLDFLYAGSSVRATRLQLQQAVKSSRPSETPGTKQLLVDVSVIIRGDARTGIQRVVRAILSELQKNPPASYKIRPVFASATNGYHYAPDGFSLRADNAKVLSMPSKRLHVASGDVFLGLDLAAALLPKHEQQLRRWKLQGVKIHMVVYDLLPVLHPEWFHGRTTRNFYRWLRAVAVLADSTICISNTVKDELQKWVASKYKITTSDILVQTIPMGSDLEASVPSLGLPEDSSEVLRKISQRPTALMVGTLEPRKGHSQILDAFDNLWADGHQYNLVIVGKAGWKTSNLINRLYNHDYYNKNLFWISNASDEYLEILYKTCYGLILASYDEGCGLPLAEAVAARKPVFARDISVLREMNVVNITWFDESINVKTLTKKINLWLKMESVNLIAISPKLKFWSESVQVLLSIILSSNTKITIINKV